MRMTERKQKIIDLVSVINQDDIIAALQEFSGFGLDYFYSHLFNEERYNDPKAQSRRVSLYRTLRGMVADGLLVKHKKLIGGLMGGLNYWESSYHLPHKLEHDLQVVADWEAGSDERMAQGIKEFVATFAGRR